MLFDNFDGEIVRTHGVAAACWLARPEVWVRLPLSALDVLSTACGKVWNSAWFGTRRTLVQIQSRRLMEAARLLLNELESRWTVPSAERRAAGLLGSFGKYSCDAVGPVLVRASGC
jgi:hypothetical protein